MTSWISPRKNRAWVLPSPHLPIHVKSCRFLGEHTLLKLHFLMRKLRPHNATSQSWLDVVQTLEWTWPVFQELMEEKENEECKFQSLWEISLWRSEKENNKNCYPSDLIFYNNWLLNFQKRNINYFHLRARGILQSRASRWETSNLPSTKENWSKKQWQLQRCVLVDSENNREFTCREN